ncbi:MAG: Trehalose synthase [Candidatus Methanofastidiosum methylothiophilum]|uniref:Trehalose synthase n=1 Tax=Candidatus Methanofastidiosum methylothiophilum TaxID=1705564 RepID=A0A150IK52_9EURY|nr:MAG: Trehalose synthase [Candidatus Methanofastidiosum methylthiophilus]KYC48465.1 MAG: Trehalose synthase [Candidatus Methanofastidiosum methylthiophilus]KYC49907.1 MAG: Trehalose synthase [Candidatus Methanofastidiosum methylthiophilus]
MSDLKLSMKLEPIYRISSIEKIIVLRGGEGPEINKVIYSNIPNTKIIRDILRFFNGIILGKKYKTSLVISYYLVPHGILGYYVSRIIGAKFCISIIGDLLYHINTPFLGKFYLRVLRNSDFITVTGAKSKEILMHNCVEEDKIFILPNVINMNDYVCDSVTEKEYDISFIGRLTYVKRLDIFFKVISEVVKEIPWIKVAIIGDGEDLEKYKSLVKELSLDKNVIFLGFRKNINELINKSKILLLTSESEGMPSVIIESMACGVPVISSDVGDIGDIVQDGKNGFLIEKYDDVDAYKDKIIKILSDKKVYKKMKEESLKVRNIHSVENASKIWEQIFSKVA